MGTRKPSKLLEAALALSAEMEWKKDCKKAHSSFSVDLWTGAFKTNKATFEGCANMAVSTAILHLSVSVCGVMSVAEVFITPWDNLFLLFLVLVKFQKNEPA